MLAFAYQVADVFAFLVLAASGLAIIFGMMGIINMAHGELITCGAYVTTAVARSGAPLPLAILVGALAAGALGIALERTIVFRFYNRPIESLVVTWGVSLIFTQGALLVLGSAWSRIGTPLGSIAFGDYSFAIYRLVMLAVAIGVLLGLYLLFMKTRFGVHARATMQNPAMARALGVPVGRIYTQTFGIGAALAGLAGGIYAPTLTLSPTMGTTLRGRVLRHRRRRRGRRTDGHRARVGGACHHPRRLHCSLGSGLRPDWPAGHRLHRHSAAA